MELQRDGDGPSERTTTGQRLASVPADRIPPGPQPGVVTGHHHPSGVAVLEGLRRALRLRLAGNLERDTVGGPDLRLFEGECVIRSNLYTESGQSVQRSG